MLKRALFVLHSFAASAASDHAGDEDSPASASQLAYLDQTKARKMWQATQRIVVKHPFRSPFDFIAVILAATMEQHAPTQSTVATLVR